MSSSRGNTVTAVCNWLCAYAQSWPSQPEIGRPDLDARDNKMFERKRDALGQHHLRQLAQLRNALLALVVLAVAAVCDRLVDGSVFCSVITC